MVTAGIAAVVLSQSSAHQHLRPGEAVASSEAIATGRHHRSEVRSASNVVELALENLKGGRSGTIEVELHEDWAPIGVDRFRALVKDGYFSTNGKSQGDKFFRVIPGFIAQFGLNGNPDVTAKWQNNLKDDAVKQSNKKGTLTFATAGPGTRTTQLFFNLADNAFLDGQGFSPIGKVVKGLHLLGEIRDHPDEGGPDQNRVENEGDSYLEQFAEEHNTQFSEITNGAFA